VERNSRVKPRKRNQSELDISPCRSSERVRCCSWFRSPFAVCPTGREMGKLLKGRDPFGRPGSRWQVPQHIKGTMCENPEWVVMLAASTGLLLTLQWTFHNQLSGWQLLKDFIRRRCLLLPPALKLTPFLSVTFLKIHQISASNENPT
jgi:hypothetical protein